MKLGDAVKAATDAVGIPQCGGCAERQKALNEAGERAAELYAKIARLLAPFQNPSPP